MNAARTAESPDRPVAVVRKGAIEDEGSIASHPTVTVLSPRRSTGHGKVGFDVCRSLSITEKTARDGSRRARHSRVRQIIGNTHGTNIRRRLIQHSKR